MQIPDLRDALQIVLRDATDRQFMWKSAETISSQDGLSLIKRLFTFKVLFKLFFLYWKYN